MAADELPPTEESRYVRLDPEELFRELDAVAARFPPESAEHEEAARLRSEALATYLEGTCKLLDFHIRECFETIKARETAKQSSLLNNLFSQLYASSESSVTEMLELYVDLAAKTKASALSDEMRDQLSRDALSSLLGAQEALRAQQSQLVAALAESSVRVLGGVGKPVQPANPEQP